METAKAFSYIRFSSIEQSKGRSKERQLEKALAYIVSRNAAPDAKIKLELDDRTFQDLGVSAWTGENIEVGELGAFLDACRQKAIPKGSFLLVESLDRVSRQTARHAANTIGDIVDQGITVVDLSDGGREYNTEALKDGMAFLMMTVRFIRANEESQRKSERLIDAWGKKKKLAANQVPMTKMVPAWLKLNADRKGYTVIKDRALIIKRIYEEAASGLGMYAINRRLNEQKVPHIGKKVGWKLPYIFSILKNRAVLGEFQPHKTADGKRIPDGDPVPYYYPAIIEQELFDRVQRGIASRRIAGSGRKGKGYSSLFSGLLKCEHCQSTVYLENKGHERYLVCSNSRSHKRCPSTRWRYDHFENSVLHFLSKQIDLTAVISTNRENDRLYMLDAQIEGLEGRKLQLDVEWKKWSSIADKIIDAVDDVAKELDRIVRDRNEINIKLQQLTAERNVIIGEREAMSQDDIKALIEGLANTDEAERYKARSDLAMSLKKVVARFDVSFAIPEEYWRSVNERELAQVKAIKKEVSKLIKEEGRDPSEFPIPEPSFIPPEMIEQYVEVGTKQSFTVVFKTGQKEHAHPNQLDAFDPEIMRSRKTMEWLAKQGYDTTDPFEATKAYLYDPKIIP